MIITEFTPFPVLTTERLLLRAITKEDVKDIFAMRSDKSVMKYIGRPLAKTLDDAEKLIEMIQGIVTENKGINYGITIKGSDRIIGTVGFWNMSKPDGRAEIGYMLHGDFHQKGIMPEALTAVLKYGFEKMNLHSVEARVHPENSPSIRVLLKKGFKKEAHFRQNYFFEGAFLDTVAFGLLKSEY